MKKLTSLPKSVRILIPTALIIIWFAVAGIGGPYFGKISEVASNDQSTFLPSSAESTQVNKELKKFQDQQSLPAIIVFNKDEAKLSSETIASIRTATAPLAELSESAGDVSPPVISEDGKAALVVVNMNSNADYKDFTKTINKELTAASLPVNYAITGPVGFLNDLGGAFSGIDGILLGVALAVVFVILLIVYRSPVLPFIVLINSMFALCAAILVVFYLAKAGIIALNGQVQGILFILVIGAATDYALLYVARYREELTRHEAPYKAIIASWKRSLEPIVAAGGTVIAGLLCLLLSDLNSNKALGPVGAIGISLAIIATLTLLPSLLLVWGRKAFWPRAPKYQKKPLTIEAEHAGIWPRAAKFISNHSRPIWITTAVVLVVMAAGLTQLKANGVSQSDFILGKSEARDGQAIIDAHFPGGSGTPTYIIAKNNTMDAVVTAVDKDAGVASVSVRANNSPSGTLPLGKYAQQLGPGAFAFSKATPKVVDNEILLEVTLEDAADSEAAQNTVVRLRNSVHTIDDSSRIGGTAAVQLDTRVSSEHDRAVVIPAVLIIITIILMLLLRSILAPLILLLTTMLSFAATLGLSALIFNNIFHFPGADPSVVLYGFIFLVALGIDYNIFLMTRVREESLRVGTRKGMLIGLIVTGSVITSAGIVLASTFAALAVIPILFLAQLAFIVAFGVLLDTIVVRSLLVPAFVYDIGKRVWWPSKKHKD
jgi:RND superfamily putative drug exporter